MRGKLGSHVLRVLWHGGWQRWWCMLNMSYTGRVICGHRAARSLPRHAISAAISLRHWLLVTTRISKVR